jgi:hypothetical protein
MEQNKPLTPRQLAGRWNISEQTLANWRSAGRGPDYMKIGHTVLYDPAAVQTFEKRNIQKAGRR